MSGLPQRQFLLMSSVKCILCNFLWKPRHFEYYHLITQEVKYFPLWGLLCCLVYAVAMYISGDFSKLFLWSMYSSSHAVSQVFFTLAYIQPVFERDLLACEEKGGGGGRKRREQGQRQEQAQLLTASTDHGSVRGPWSQLRLSLRFCLPWACIQPWAWLSNCSPPHTNPQANRSTSDSLPILPAWLWQLVCEPGCGISAQLLRLGPSLDYKWRLQLSCPELQVRWETAKPTGSVLQVAPTQVRQTKTIHHNKLCSALFRVSVQSPKLGSGYCHLQGGCHDEDRLEQGQVKTPRSFPTIFKWPFPGFNNPLDAVRLWRFSESWQVSSARSWLICGAAYSSFCWHHCTVHLWMTQSVHRNKSLLSPNFTI